MLNIKPFGKNILVRPVERKQVLVSDDGTLNEYGEVVAVGGDVGSHWFWLFKILGIKRKNSIKIGDKIGFSVFGVEKLVIEEEKLYFVRESDEFLLGLIIE